MRDRIALAYRAALQAAHSSKSVSVHIGPEVRDFLRSLATVEDPTVIQNRFFGFPVVVEDEWPRDQIVVRTNELIL